MHLSAMMHISCAIYRKNKSGFIPSQLMFDTQIMGKAAFFNVAKTQIDNQDGSYWIIQQGTDALEKIFGVVRTMIGNDTNVDLYQLAGRLTAAVESQKILAEHPEWDAAPKRLNLAAMYTQSEQDNLQKYDHINPASWKGCCKVRGIVLRSAWDLGREAAVSALIEAGMDNPFPQMEATVGCDLLCPFGNNIVVCVVQGKE